MDLYCNTDCRSGTYQLQHIPCKLVGQFVGQPRMVAAWVDVEKVEFVCCAGSYNRDIPSRNLQLVSRVKTKQG